MTHPTLEQIQAPIKEEMRLFEDKFQQAVRTKVALLDRIMFYIIKRKGKQMRPMFVFLSAGATGGINERTYRGASLVELLHTATLIHDDVVDNSMQRRSFFSINALWKNKIAVLVGDYLLSRGLLLSVDNEDYDLLKISSEAVKAMSEGELLQLEKSRGINLDESVYFEVIRMKTASLIASCCAMGAKSSGADDVTVQKLRRFGEKVGIAFQIKDDLFDYHPSDAGKPAGQDVRDKKITLPLLYALNAAPRPERKAIIREIDNGLKGKDSLKRINAFVHERGGIAYAEAVMARYQAEAFLELDVLTPSPFLVSLKQLVEYTVSRGR